VREAAWQTLTYLALRLDRLGRRPLVSFHSNGFRPRFANPFGPADDFRFCHFFILLSGGSPPPTGVPLDLDIKRSNAGLLPAIVCHSLNFLSNFRFREVRNML